MNLKIFTINGVSGNKIWQMTNGGSIGQLLFHGQRSSGETVPRHFHMELPQLYKVDRWIHNRSPVIVQTEHGRPMSNDRLLSVAWFFFSLRKSQQRGTNEVSQRELRLSLPKANSWIAIPELFWSTIFIYFNTSVVIILRQVNVKSRILLLLQINASSTYSFNSNESINFKVKQRF